MIGANMLDESNTEDKPIDDEFASTEEEVVVVEDECTRQHMT